MIEVKHLTKRYGDHTAVSDLNFTIEKGHIYGFLGPNGAGKSTTMNIMTGCLAATAGDVTIGGHDIFEEPMEAKRLIGYLPEQPPVYMDRTPREYLTFVARAKGIHRSEVQKQVQAVMEKTRITDVADRLCKNLSKGYRQRVGIAQALLGNPEVVILDEPTVGLDPRQIIEIRELIRQLGQDHTVILSSHILSEVQAVCEIILIISKGRLVAYDTPENLESRFAGTAEILLTAEATEEEVREIAEPIPDVTAIKLRSVGTDKKTGAARCSVTLETDTPDGDSVCRDAFLAFAAAERPILSLAARTASLEDIFLELTRTDEKVELSVKDAAAETAAQAETAPDGAAENAQDQTDAAETVAAEPQQESEVQAE